jgi:hypothetical protein
MHEEKQEGEGALGSEALKRDEWRGEEMLLNKDDAPSHTLPESERNAAGQDGNGNEGSGLVSSTILPPD